MNKTQLVKSSYRIRDLVGGAPDKEHLALSLLVETFPRYYNIKSKTSLPVDFAVRLKRFEKDAPRLLGKNKTDHRNGLGFNFLNSWLDTRSPGTDTVYRLFVETRRQKITGFLHRQVADYFK